MGEFRATGVESHHSEGKPLFNVVSAIRCTTCLHVVWSRYRHDFNTCGCGRVAIDGGRSYTRIVENQGNFESFILCIPWVKGLYELGRLRPREDTPGVILVHEDEKGKTCRVKVG